MSRQPLFKKSLAGIGLCLIVLMMTTGGSKESMQVLASTEAATASDLFAYDNQADFAVKDIKTEQRGDVTIRDITFVGVDEPIKAYLVVPAGSGPFAGILYVHWLGQSPNANRTQFLEEAIQLASEGTVSLMIDAMWAAPGWYPNRVPEKDYENSIKQVIVLRRAMDLLLAQPNIDPQRIGYVGHDFGAMYGALMAGVDQRASTYVFLAGTSRFELWYLYGAQPKSPEEYTKQMQVLDPVNHVKKIKDAPIFFQYAEGDSYIPAQEAANFYNAAPTPKYMATYKARHDMGTDEIAADRIVWLEKHLGLTRKSQ